MGWSVYWVLGVVYGMVCLLGVGCSLWDVSLWLTKLLPPSAHAQIYCTTSIELDPLLCSVGSLEGPA